MLLLSNFKYNILKGELIICMDMVIQFIVVKETMMVLVTDPVGYGL